MAGIDPRPRIEKANRLKNPKYKQLFLADAGVLS